MAITFDPETLRVLDLPPKNRALLAKKLLASLDETEISYEDLWVGEAEKRHQAILDGRTVTKPAA